MTFCHSGFQRILAFVLNVAMKYSVLLSALYSTSMEYFLCKKRIVKRLDFACNDHFM